MKLKKKIIILENEIDLKTWLSWNKSYNSYNGVLILNQIYNLFVKIQLNYIEKLIT